MTTNAENDKVIDKKKQKKKRTFWGVIKYFIYTLIILALIMVSTGLFIFYTTMSSIGDVDVQVIKNAMSEASVVYDASGNKIGEFKSSNSRIVANYEDIPDIFKNALINEKLLYSLKKLKPNIIWLIVFEIGFVVTTILTWQDALDLLPLVALLSAGYGSWQDNPTILRVSYIINNGSYVIYNAIIGAYISMVFKIITFLSSVICFIYYCLLKKETPILDVIFKRKKIVENNIDNTNVVDNNNEKEEPINNDIGNDSDTKNDEIIDNKTNNIIT